jgi:hypothetical protein
MVPQARQAGIRGEFHDISRACPQQPAAQIVNLSG